MEDLTITVTSIRPVVGTRLTDPIEKELSTLHSVNVESDEWGEPPAAGFTEIACIIAVGGGVPLLIKFFEPLVTSAGEAFRDRVLNLIKRGKQNKAGTRRYVPLCIEFGTEYTHGHLMTPVRYYFHGNPDEAELLLILKAANEHIHSLPTEVFSYVPRQPEYGFYWDSDRKEWRGRVLEPDEELPADYWFPRNLFRDE